MLLAALLLLVVLMIGEPGGLLNKHGMILLHNDLKTPTKHCVMPLFSLLTKIQNPISYLCSPSPSIFFFSFPALQ